MSKNQKVDDVSLKHHVGDSRRCPCVRTEIGIACRLYQIAVRQQGQVG
ncbi:MAG: hypothetical protein LBF88_10410 [Planctomycetaceae bacterium]|jgi:hypothetical protein|nr:hypothetical protein [Planctomycetaceae bacterium]